MLTRRKGFSLIEAAIVLAIVGAVIGGIWVASAAVSYRNKTETFVLDVRNSVEKLRRFQWSGTMTSADMVALKILPDAYAFNQTYGTFKNTDWSIRYAISGTPSRLAVSALPFNPASGTFSAKDCTVLANSMVRNFTDNKSQPQARMYLAGNNSIVYFSSLSGVTADQLATACADSANVKYEIAIYDLNP